MDLDFVPWTGNPNVMSVTGQSVNRSLCGEHATGDEIDPSPAHGSAGGNTSVWHE